MEFPPGIPVMGWLALQGPRDTAKGELDRVRDVFESQCPQSAR